MKRLRHMIVGVLGFFSLAFTNKIPLFFIENQGQADPKIKFYLKGPAQSVLFGQREIVYSTSRRTIRQRFVNANKSLSLKASRKLSGKVNYLVGKNEKDWRQNISTYEKISYQNLYPGIDLVFSGAEGKLKSEFRVARGADYKKILVAYEGADPLTLSDAGDVIIKNAAQEMREEGLVIYQIIGGKKVFVEGKFVVGRNQYHFEISRYDPNHSLIIDPTIVFSTYFGGNEDDFADAIATDPSGNVYIAGYTGSADFYTSPTAFQRTQRESSRAPGVRTTDAFVIKLNPRGSLIYSTYLGGGNTDQAHAIAVNASGNAFITGGTDSSDFPTTPGAFKRSLPNRHISAFVVKLNPTGSALVYSTYLGGDVEDVGAGIALDSGGNAYVTGHTTSYTFPTTDSAYQSALGGSEEGGASVDVFVSKLNSIGSSLIYSTYVGGIGWDETGDIAADADGNAFVTGFAGLGFPIISSATQETFGGGEHDAFVFKLNATGSALIYSTYLGGVDNDGGTGIAVRNGKAFVVGTTNSADFPTTSGALREIFVGGASDVFVAKLNGSGSSLHYSTFLGGAGDDVGYGIAVNGGGNAYVTGTTDGPFPVTPSAYQESFGGVGDAFVSILNMGGSLLIYSSYLGGSGEDKGMGIALAGSNNVFVTGVTSSENFPRVSALQGDREGQDIFVTKIHFGP